MIAPKRSKLQRLSKGYIAFARGPRIPKASVSDTADTEEGLSPDSICECIDKAYSASFGSHSGVGRQGSELLADFGHVMSSLAVNMGERRLFTTSTQRLGKGPTLTQPGDEVCILCGSKVPYVLRPVRGGEYELLGEAYVHGIMQGEALDVAVNRFRTITLV